MADENTQQGTAGGNAGEAPARQIVMQKIYVKDLSFESPKSPDVFRSSAVPQTQLNLRSANKALDDDFYEVSLTLTVEAKENDATLFLIELTQAGLFLIRGYTDAERGSIVGSFCPNTLYPFAREAVADIVSKGGFPQLLLQPINFDAIYSQAIREQTGQKVEAAVAPVQGEQH